MSRILAIQLKRIGDLVLTVPALTLLKRKRPGDHVTLVTWGAAGQIVPAVPAVDEHLNYRPWRPNGALWLELLSQRFDAVLDFNGSDRSILFSWLSGAALRATYTKRTQGFPRNRVFHRTSEASLKHLHTIDHMIALLECLDIASEPEPLALSLPAESGLRAAECLAEAGLAGQAYAVVHAGTARDEKYWLPERWAEVIRVLLEEHGLPTVLTGGRDPVEARHLAAIRGQLPGIFPPQCRRVPQSFGNGSLAEKRPRRPRGRYCGDASAAAFQRPQIVLYGPTPPWLWRPRHENAVILHATQDEPLPVEPFVVDGPLGAMGDIRSSTVIRALRDLMRGL
ncbi:MAG: glycosyltransferase family 9 protein [Verrucomicrobiales bacterium]